MIKRGARALGIVVVVALGWMTVGRAAAEAKLIAFGDGGLKLGATALYAKKVDGAAYDPAQELVWFTAAGTLYVIDLRDPAHPAVPIAKKMPEGGFGITGLSSAGWNVTYAGIYPVLTLGKALKVTTGSGAYGDIWEDQDKAARKAIKKVKLVGAKWFATQKKRAPRALPPAPKVGELTGKLVVLPEGVGECDGSSAECGDTMAFGDTGFQLIVTSSGCGDACHLACLLYDPKTRKFAVPSAAKSPWSATPTVEDAGSCMSEDYGLRAGGEYYIGGNRCTVSAAGVACVAAEGWGYVGWVE